MFYVSFLFFLPVLRVGRIDFGFIGTIASSRQSPLTASPQRPIQFSVSGLNDHFVNLFAQFL